MPFSELIWIQLNYALTLADVKTLRILSRVRWMNTDIQNLIDTQLEEREKSSTGTHQSLETARQELTTISHAEGLEPPQ